MRILADENLPRPSVEFLRSCGHDVLWARTHCPAWRDSALLDFAEADGRIVLTLDKDFLQIALQRRVPLEASGIVLFRSHPATESNVHILIEAFLASPNEWAGHVSVITPETIQIFPTRH